MDFYLLTIFSVYAIVLKDNRRALKQTSYLINRVNDADSQLLKFHKRLEILSIINYGS